MGDADAELAADARKIIRFLPVGTQGLKLCLAAMHSLYREGLFIDPVEWTTPVRTSDT